MPQQAEGDLGLKYTHNNDRMGKVETQETQIRHNDKGEANLNKVHTGQETIKIRLETH